MIFRLKLEITDWGRHSGNLFDKLFLQFYFVIPVTQIPYFAQNGLKINDNSVLFHLHDILLRSYSSLVWGLTSKHEIMIGISDLWMNHWNRWTGWEDEKTSESNFLTNLPLHLTWIRQGEVGQTSAFFKEQQTCVPVEWRLFFSNNSRSDKQVSELWVIHSLTSICATVL